MIGAARILMQLGIGATVVGLSFLHASNNDYSYTGSSRFGFSLGFMALLALATYALGLPHLVADRRSALLAALKATLGAAFMVSLVQFFVGDKLLPRFVVLGSALVLTPWFALCSALALSGSRRAVDRARVFVVGTEGNRKALADDLEFEPEHLAIIVGGISPGEERPDIASLELKDLVAESRANILVLDRSALLDEEVVSQAAALHISGLRTRSLTAFYERWLGKLPISELERASLMFDIGEVHHARYWRVKRMADIVIAALGLILLAVAVPVVFIGNRLSGIKGVFFRQVRIGKGGREFRMHKFVTMSEESAGDFAQWTQLDDPRISSFGRFLRRSHMDELPQVIDILKGDLSFVGPRPEQPHYVKALSEVLPYYTLRYSVTPGLTGWAQVKFGYAGNDSDAREKLQYDFYYLMHQGLRFDLVVIGRTLRNVVGLRGR